MSVVAFAVANLAGPPGPGVRENAGWKGRGPRGLAHAKRREMAAEGGRRNRGRRKRLAKDEKKTRD